MSCCSTCFLHSVVVLTDNFFGKHLFEYVVISFVCAGIWIKSSWVQVQREGNQLSLTYIVPQLGYWVTAMSSLHAGEKIHWHEIN